MVRPEVRGRALAALGLCGMLALSGCDSAEDRAFVSDCRSRLGLTQAQCSCVKDLINDGIADDKGRSWLKAVVVGDEARAAQIQSTFGLLEGGRIVARAGWLATNAPQACGVSI